jgi:hypothetical protein
MNEKYIQKIQRESDEYYDELMEIDNGISVHSLFWVGVGFGCTKAIKDTKEACKNELIKLRKAGWNSVVINRCLKELDNAEPE